MESPTHCGWAPPGHFRLRASGTFFDALAYAKPLVYTTNSYIDSYYEQEPGIGVRCQTVEEVPQAILSLIEHHTIESYASCPSYNGAPPLPRSSQRLCLPPLRWDEVRRLKPEARSAI